MDTKINVPIWIEKIDSVKVTEFEFKKYVFRDQIQLNYSIDVIPA